MKSIIAVFKNNLNCSLFIGEMVDLSTVVSKGTFARMDFWSFYPGSHRGIEKSNKSVGKI